MIADDYAAIAKAQKALETKPEPRVDVMEPLLGGLDNYTRLYGEMMQRKALASAPAEWWSFVPHDPVVAPCDSGE